MHKPPAKDTALQPKRRMPAASNSAHRPYAPELRQTTPMPSTGRSAAGQVVRGRLRERLSEPERCHDFDALRLPRWPAIE